MCSHRDKAAGISGSDEIKHAAAAEKLLWVRRLLEDDQYRGPCPSGTPNIIESDVADNLTTLAPAWMTAAPKDKLYLHRYHISDGPSDDDKVPYPDKFVAIVRAVQKGERIEGIVEIPDLVMRNSVSSTNQGQLSYTFEYKMV